MKTMSTALSAVAISVLAGLGGQSAAWGSEPRFGAVAVYAAPPEAGAPPGRAFAAPTEAQVIDIAVQSCRANTIKDQWGNCAVGRWIGTGNELLVASVCTAIDDEGRDHQILFFLKDGVTASDEQIRSQAGLTVNNGHIPAGGCRKVAVYERDKPALTDAEDSLVVRSVAKEAPAP